MFMAEQGVGKGAKMYNCEITTAETGLERNALIYLVWTRDIHGALGHLELCNISSFRTWHVMTRSYLWRNIPGRTAVCRWCQ